MRNRGPKSPWMLRMKEGSVLCWESQHYSLRWGQLSASSFDEEDITYHYAWIRDHCPGSRITGGKTKVRQTSPMCFWRGGSTHWEALLGFCLPWPFRGAEVLCSQKIVVILQKCLGSDGKVCDSVETASRSQGCVVQGCKEQQFICQGPCLPIGAVDYLGFS